MTSASTAKGFTLVEVVIATVVLSLGLIGALTAFSMASRVTATSRNDTIISLLARQKLAEVQLEHRNALTPGTTAGDFGEDYPDYRWQLTVEEPDELHVVQIHLAIFAPQAGRERETRFSTAIF